MKKKKINEFSSTASFAFFSLALTAGIVGMFMFIKIMGENTKYEEKVKKTTTTTVPTTAPVIETEDDKNNKQSVSYVTTLKDVLGDNEVKGDYAISIEYQGTNYYFRCTNYDSETKECASGIALLQYNNNAIPLYVFSDKEINYALSDKEYFIIVDDEYVVFTHDNNTVVYTSSGEKYLELNNILTSYDVNSDGNTKKEEVYPSISNDALNYYMCDTNTVFKRDLSLEKKSVLKQEIVINATC